MAPPNKNLIAKKGVNGAFSTDGETDWSSIATTIKHEGKQIVLPGDPSEMGYDDAIATLQRVKEQENQKFDTKELVRGAPYDAAVAVYQAIQHIYGAVTIHSAQSFFGEILPDFVTVDTGPGDADKIQIPLGNMRVPHFEETISVNLHPLGCQITGIVRKKDQARLIEIAVLARQILKSNSVYRGKAISLNVSDEGTLGLTDQPTFLTLDKSEADLVYTPDVELLVKTCVLSPLKNTAACRRNRIPLKRGILLEGRYGTGKSLTAMVAASVAVDNGWTFVNLSKAQGLKEAIRFAKTYQPTLIFAEDIDRCADRSNESVNDLVNTMDGLIGKDDEIMVVLTTNHIEKIDKALLRPGRLDAIITIHAPDQQAVRRLIKLYARDLIDEGADLSRVGAQLEGQIPATIREVVERSKLFALTQDREHIAAEDLEAAALAMKPHFDLLGTKTPEPTTAELFASSFVRLVAEGNLVASAKGETDFAAGLERLSANLGRKIAQVGESAEGARIASTVAAVESSAASRNTRKAA